jgi:hypothetical protein
MGAFKRRLVHQPGMQDDAGANSGERNAEHQGDEVFVHGESPSAIVLGASPAAISTISQSLGM